jgi:hypothetical protein
LTSEDTFDDGFVEKPLEEYSEEEIKEMFLSMFFWVSENRPDWLQEAINRKKEQLKKYAEEAVAAKDRGL